MSKNVNVNIGDLVFCREGGPSVGAVRAVEAHALTIDIEGLGDVSLPASQIEAVHEGKVVLAFDRLSPELQAAVAHANADESLYR
ncbi:MAG: hypothetical protein U1F43_25845 [Myxococcota bacterium]